MATRVVINQAVVQHITRSPAGPVGQRLARVGLQIESRAKVLAPVDTGRLQSSIRTTSPRLVGDRLVVQVGSNVTYARYVEEGTKFMAAQPYLRPAIGVRS